MKKNVITEKNTAEKRKFRPCMDSTLMNIHTKSLLRALLDRVMNLKSRRRVFRGAKLKTH